MIANLLDAQMRLANFEVTAGMFVTPVAQAAQLCVLFSPTYFENMSEARAGLLSSTTRSPQCVFLIEVLSIEVLKERLIEIALQMVYQSSIGLL